MPDVPNVNPATIAFIRQEQQRRRKRRVVATTVGVVAIAGIGFASVFASGKYKASQQAAAAKQMVAEIKPGDREAWQRMRLAVDNGELTREQARAALEAARDAQMQKTMDGYFQTPAKGREKFLDKMIDEQVKRMAEWQRDRPTTGPTTRPERRDRPTSRPNDAQGAAQRDAEREQRGRARADNQSPVQRAQRTEFMAAMRARMKERGIEMPRGGPGGRGPGGGGGGRRD